ncbi:MATE family efflux transporter [candidate division WOR-3 bacterium]|uniref:Multidrug-efflux transporter n=1 Tax=candidate division WOR-3 bacterium TaxID=2052148 RepID=A0A9D5KAE6_UNCW3|nr:MATE family efflux transporter [candidate division WOR-3 bacterium]MBD3365060.1 MATE family efflux transporter [candidate division WOR-3 bacterium]
MPEPSLKPPPGTKNAASSILGTLLRLAWPVVLTTLLTQLMLLADAFWIGRLQIQGALAAIGISGAVYGVLMTVAQLITTPAVAYVGRYTGEGNSTLARGALFHSIIICLILSVVLSVVGLFSSTYILQGLSASPEIAILGEPYLKILFLILPFAWLGTLGLTVIQSTGDYKRPLVVLIFSIAVNLILDPILILGLLGFPRLGTLGAGIATGIATLFNLMGAFLILNRKRLLGISALRWKVVANFLKVGFGSMICVVIWPVSVLVVFYIVGLSEGAVGTAAQDAFTVGTRIIAVFYAFLTGLSTATQALIRRSLAARSVQTARRVTTTAALWGTVFQILLSFLAFTFAAEIISVFSPGSKDAVTIGTQYLKIIAPFLLAAPISAAFKGALFGAGKVLGPTIASVAGNLAVKIPLTLILSLVADLGPTGVWLAIGISLVIEALLSGIGYFSGKWTGIRQ